MPRVKKTYSKGQQRTRKDIQTADKARPRRTRPLTKSAKREKAGILKGLIGG